MPRRVIDRRAFLGTSAGAFICTIGGREIAVRSPEDATKADAVARAVARPADLEPTGPFAAPQPAPGGTRSEYWIQAPRP
jgi:manganese oxidase